MFRRTAIRRPPSEWLLTGDGGCGVGGDGGGGGGLFVGYGVRLLT